MFKSKLSFVLAASFLTSSCGLFKEKHDHDPRPTAPVKQYFTHGDPYQLIEGASLNSSSFLITTELEKFDGFHVSGAFQFTEREEQYNPKDWDEVENSNSTETTLAEISEFLSPVPYSFKKVSNVEYIYQPTDPSDRTEYNWSLTFKVASEKLQLVAIDKTPVKVLHYSLKENGEAFSFLVEYEGGVDYGKSILSVVFAATKDVQKVPTPVEDFAFLFANIPIGWQEAIELHVCGEVTDLEMRSIEASLDSWLKDEALQTARQATPVKLVKKAKFAPFSDLNDHCLMLVDDFKLENSTNFYVAGVDLPVVDKAKKSIIDSDIFIFMDHKASSFKGSAESTTTHEIGHFLGLGHEFSEDEDGIALYESIMGYSQGVNHVAERDYEAIRVLYDGPLITDQ